MRRLSFTLALATFAFSGLCLAQEYPKVGIVPSDDGLFPFVISYDMAKGVTDFSSLLDAPAGKHGFTRIEGQHFVNDAGRIRFNGANIVGGACFPSHEQAERLAARLAHFGINCVRLHFFDLFNYNYRAYNEKGLLEDDGTWCTINPEQMDLFDYMVYQFKKHGIYYNVNLMVGRPFKGKNAYDKDIQQKELDYARNLFTHVNPYTGLTLPEDPAMAMVELNNEADHWNNMRTYLKKELGVMAPVTSTQVSYSQPSTFDGMDFYDNHAYWLHPTIGVFWKQNTAPMVNEPNGGTLPGLASRRFAGKPYTISEYNHPYPSFYGAEGQPMLHAYAAFQGWDGVFAYSWNNRINEEPDHMEYFFSYAARTDCLAHFNACAAMFLRGDVQEGEDGVTAIVPLKAFEDEWVKKPTRNGDIITLIKDGTGMTKQDMLLHKTTVDVHADKSVAVKTSEPAAVKISDTKQIEWNNEDPENGMFMVKTPNVKVFSGFLKGRTADLGDGVTLNIGKTKLGWATISLTSKEGSGFEKGTSLLVATGYTHNKDAKFKRELDKDGNPTTTISSRWYDWGTGPMMTEGIPATVTLPSAAEATTCWALDESGARKVEVPVTKGADGKAVVEIGEKYQTVWYEISV
ncbi:MAG: hypothetical protein IKW89_09290 [Bacteroidales bacterium]|nr:hypothetical protein [Bacteroidales bacterium]